MIPALVVTVAGASLFATTTAFAQDKPTDPQTSLVQKIADRFNLNKDDVQKVFDEERATHGAKMEQRFETKLDQLVKDGKLTEDQKTKIVAKFKQEEADRKANMDKMKSMTPAQRKDAMKAHMDELKQWAQDNGIDLNILFDGHKGMMRMGWK